VVAVSLKNELEDMFVIEPAHPWWSQEHWTGGERLRDGFCYASDSNDQWLTHIELEDLLREVT
jgi:UDP-N-acetylglucosamine 4,6-dehydratase